MTARSCRYDPAKMTSYGSGRRVDAPPSPRELDVLNHLARGKSYQETGDALGISRHTVKNHISRLIQHAKAVNLAGVLFAFGWTKVPDQRDLNIEAEAGRAHRDIEAAVGRAHKARADLDAALAKARL